MNLKQKLCEPFGGLRKDTLNELEQIVDDFTIGFTEWADNNYFRVGNTSMWTASLDYDDDIVYQTKELLKIYKTEKELI